MSGYIRKNKRLRTQAEVLRLRAILCLGRREVLGALDLLWMLADDQADRHGRIKGYSPAMIDEECETPGFSAALQDAEIDWARFDERGCTLPRYSKYNQSHKKREQDAERQRKYRDRHGAVTRDAESRTRHASVTRDKRTQHSTAQRSQHNPEQNSPAQPSPRAETAAEGNAPEPAEVLAHRSAGGPVAAAENPKQHRRLVLAGIRPDHPDLARWASEPRLTGEFLDDLLRRRMAKKAGAGWVVNAIKSHLGEAIDSG